MAGAVPRHGTSSADRLGRARADRHSRDDGRCDGCRPVAAAPAHGEAEVAENLPGTRRVLIRRPVQAADQVSGRMGEDRKSTRLNSSHVAISYAVFCLKKKNNNLKTQCETQTI